MVSPHALRVKAALEFFSPHHSTILSTMWSMPIDDMRTVWLLGAGFSKSLGGPLLVDLFQPRSWKSDQERFPGEIYPKLADEVFHSRACFNAGKRDGLWADAEEFLVFVDSAYRNGIDDLKRRLLQELGTRMSWGYDNLLPGWQWDKDKFKFEIFKDFGRIVRRGVAAECSAFLSDLDPKDERWFPYEQWAKSLHRDWDTVICFNYDRVLETLEERTHAGLMSLLPSRGTTGLMDSGLLHGVPVLKLHGSVDWKRGNDGEINLVDSGELLKSEIETPFIAAPGRSKQDAVAEFGPLWELAKRKLGQADALVVIGYGFPASDAKARTEIQAAFRDGNSAQKIKRVDFVLGPNTERPDSRRVHALMQTVNRGRQVIWYPDPPKVKSAPAGFDNILYLTAHPLWAEDFIFDYRQRTRNP
jgi:hypothetical protein